jgi:hypothetical protein
VRFTGGIPLFPLLRPQVVLSSTGEHHHESPYPGAARGLDERLRRAETTVTLAHRLFFTVWDMVLAIAGPVVGLVVAFRPDLQTTQTLATIGVALGGTAGVRAVVARLVAPKDSFREPEA